MSIGDSNPVPVIVFKNNVRELNDLVVVVVVVVGAMVVVVVVVVASTQHFKNVSTEYEFAEATIELFFQYNKSITDISSIQIKLVQKPA